MANIGFATLSVIPSIRGLDRSINSQIGGPLQRAGRDAGDQTSKAFSARFASGIKGVGKTALGVFGGGALLAGASGLASQITDVFAEAREAEKVGRLTNAVIKSTGGIAKVSASDVAKLSESLSVKAGIDDELIQSSANVLLTFHKVRNEVGQGNDIFNRGAAAALNMSAALGTDLQGATIQVGKALNDPVRGVTALSRAGVQFTKQQKAQIKAMVESGDTLGAQKIILGELGTQFGGAAAAATDPMKKLGVVIQNLKERLGVALLPIVEEAATWLGENLPGAIDTAGKFFKNNLLPPLKSFSDFVRNDVIPVVVTVINWFKEHKAVAIALGIGIAALVAPFATLAVGLVVLWTRFKTFRTVVMAVVRGVSTTVRTVLTGIRAFWETWGGRISSFTRGIFNGIKTYIEGVINVIRGIIKVVTALIRGDWSAVWDGIKQIVSGAWDSIRGVVQIGVTFITSILSGAWKIIKDGVRVAWRFVLDKLNGIVDFVTGLPGRIGTAAAGMWDGIKNAFVSVINFVIRAWNGLEFKIPGFDPPGPGPKFGGFTLGVPDIPELAGGTVASKAMLAVIGEKSSRSNPEIVSPRNLIRSTVEEALKNSKPMGAQLIVNVIGAKGNREIEQMAYAGAERALRNNHVPIVRGAPRR